jgi:hypothetical protein
MLWNPGDPPTEGVAPVYYFYVDDLAALRESIIRAGLTPGAIVYPEYLPKGEMELFDPDGHQLKFAQRDEETP